MLEKLADYVSKQVYMNNLIRKRNTKNLDNSFSADKTTLAIIEKEINYDIIKIFNKTVSCPQDGFPNVIYERDFSIDTNNHFMDIETTSIALNRRGKFIAYTTPNLVILMKLHTNDSPKFVASFPITKFNKSGNYFNRSVEFHAHHFSHKESLLIFDNENTITIVENFEQGCKEEMIITEHKLNKVKALFYSLLQRVLFKFVK